MIPRTHGLPGVKLLEANTFLEAFLPGNLLTSPTLSSTLYYFPQLPACNLLACLYLQYIPGENVLKSQCAIGSTPNHYRHNLEGV
jgi:hypothetical protein